MEKSWNLGNNTKVRGLWWVCKGNRSIQPFYTKEAAHLACKYAILMNGGQRKGDAFKIKYARITEN